MNLRFQIVEHADLVATCQQFIDDVAADEPGTSSNKGLAFDGHRYGRLR